MKHLNKTLKYTYEGLRYDGFGTVLKEYVIKQKLQNELGQWQYKCLMTSNSLVLDFNKTNFYEYFSEWFVNEYFKTNSI
jgi:hypothetical protein